MATWFDAIAILVGAVASLPYVGWARRSAHPERLFAVGLGVAATIYLLLALLGGAGPLFLLLEATGVALFGGIAVAGLWGSPLWLALGWGVHVLWDLGLHPGAVPGWVPFWYPPACVGFDLLVAGFVLASFWGRALPHRTTQSADSGSRPSMT
ncbi:MAG: hypothetical protein R3244_09170 [Thermoanaerobaculia bacterium]|nr:hypothetical protein [Thermoanaerobaculia bacterium]